MGLDTVELVLRVEDTFGISISNSEAAEIFTVGQLHSCVLKKVGEAEKPGCLSSLAFYRTRRAMMQTFGIQRNDVRPESLITELVPSDDRQLRWRHLGDSIGLKLPDLVLPASLHAALWVFAPPLLITVGGIALFQLLPFYAAIPAIVLSVILFLIAGVRLTRPFANRIPGDCVTVRDLVEAIRRLNFNRLAADSRTWHEREVWDTLRSVIVDELGVTPDEVRPEARFIQDLRAD